MTIEARFQIDREGFSLNVDLSLPGTGVTALFGPSGCGKTTLLRAMAGLEHCPNGFLKVGDAIWQNGSESLPPHKRPIGYVFQESCLFTHLNVRQNLSYGLKRVAVDQQKVSLSEIISLLGIAHLQDRRPDQLSGGEQQRVAIARALAVSPAMLLLDEPLAALDFALKQEILPYLESLHRELDIPVLYVSHSRDEVARFGDHVVLMEEGRVQATGPVTELFTRLDLTLAKGVDTEAVIEAIVDRHDEQFELTYLSFSGGQFAVARNSLKPGSKVRLQILARDVSLTLERQINTSILNIFPAVIDEMVNHTEAQTTLRLLLGTTPILARVTRKSAVDLGLQPGGQVFAQIKSVALLS